MDQIKPPNELVLDESAGENWKRFKQRFEFYIQAIGATEEDDKRKIAILLSVAGSDAFDVYNTFTFTEAEKDKYDVVVQKLEQVCLPKENETSERYVFRTTMQLSG
jgi:hypothetical protein